MCVCVNVCMCTADIDIPRAAEAEANIFKVSALSGHPGVPSVQVTEGDPGKESNGNRGGREKKRKIMERSHENNF